MISSSGFITKWYGTLTRCSARFARARAHCQKASPVTGRLEDEPGRPQRRLGSSIKERAKGLARPAAPFA